MITSNGPETVAGGMDQNYYAPKNKAALVSNFRYDDDLGWINDRGYEPRIKRDDVYTSTTTEIEDESQACRFLSVWSRHQNAEVYYLEEKNGKLRYQFSNKGTATSRTVVLDEDRNIPKVDDPGTQLAGYGRFALILNGYDAPLKFWGRSLVQPFSWTQAPPPPHVMNVDPNITETATGSTPLTGTAAQIRFDKGGYWGLGDADLNSINSYTYLIAFKSNTGSISPLSGPATVRWGIDEANHEAKYGVVMDNLPVGPDGTVARIIYRTKNKTDGQTGAGDIFYYVTEVSENVSTVWIDFIPDAELVDPITTGSFAQPISHTYKYASSFNNQMFLGGGEASPTRIIFSRPNLPEEFPRYNFFDIGGSTGGHITSLFPFYGNLLVFREKSIDIISVAGIQADGSPTYQIGTLDQNVGTTATNTIKNVPGVGVCFLSRDGIYAVTGGIQGGAVFSVKKISGPVSKEMKRITVGALPRATATYSDREKEYWVHYPVNGDTENSRGCVLHTKTLEWSLRGPFNFTQLATDPNGWIVIGTYWKYIPIPTSANTIYPGLQIWSAADYWGYVNEETAVEPEIEITSTKVAKGDSIWESVWDDFGNSSVKKNVHYIEIEVIAQGNNDIECYYAADYNEAFTSAGKVKSQQAEVVSTSSSLPVYGPNSTTLKAVWGTTKWIAPHIIRMRWDLTNTTGICHFKFRIKTNKLFHLLSYKIHYTANGMKTLSTQNPSY